MTGFIPILQMKKETQRSSVLPALGPKSKQPSKNELKTSDFSNSTFYGHFLSGVYYGSNGKAAS